MLAILLFAGLLRNFILFIAFGILLWVMLLIKRNREIKSKFPTTLPKCNFKITKPTYSSFIRGVNHFKKANFSVIVKKNHKYFFDFPVMFRFYSNSAFRSKIKITYLLPGETIPEEIINQIVVFENKTKEHLYYISDVIIGRINIEIETTSDYGSPTICFEIMKNEMCNMLEQQKIEIAFDKV